MFNSGVPECQCWQSYDTELVGIQERGHSSVKPVDKEVQLADDSVGFACKSLEHASCF